MSRQAAFKRFGEPVDPRTGDPIAVRSVEGIVELTERTIAQIAAGDHDDLRGAMHPQTAEELSADLIGDTWRRVLAEVGELDHVTDTHVELPGGETALAADEQVIGTVVGVTTLVCEAGRLQGRVAVDERSLIVGLLLVPIGHAPLPF